MVQGNDTTAMAHWSSPLRCLPTGYSRLLPLGHRSAFPARARTLPILPTWPRYPTNAWSPALKINTATSTLTPLCRATPSLTPKLPAQPEPTVGFFVTLPCPITTRARRKIRSGFPKRKRLPMMISMVGIPRSRKRCHRTYPISGNRAGSAFRTMARCLVRMACAEWRDRRRDGLRHKRLRTAIHAPQQRTTYRLVQRRHNLERDTERDSNCIDGEQCAFLGVVPHYIHDSDACWTGRRFASGLPPVLCAIWDLTTFLFPPLLSLFYSLACPGLSFVT